MVTTLIAFVSLVGAGQAAESRAAFDRIKALAGEWQGVSNDGRKIRETLEVISGGSVVMQRSWFDAHPGELMATMYHLDGDQLILTHYCVAGNQPRLSATRFENGGRKLTFTFRDATNLATRDKGHMDRVVIELLDSNRIASQWTWYQKGKEQWMEKFVLTRVPSRKR
jgi:hypothetical protein